MQCQSSVSKQVYKPTAINIKHTTMWDAIFKKCKANVTNSKIKLILKPYHIIMWTTDFNLRSQAHVVHYNP